MHANVYAEARREYRVFINDSPPYCFITRLPTELEDHHFRQTYQPRRKFLGSNYLYHPVNIQSCLAFYVINGDSNSKAHHAYEANVLAYWTITPATRFPNADLSLNLLKYEVFSVPRVFLTLTVTCLFMFLGIAENSVKTERDKTPPNSWITGSVSYIVCRSPRLKALISNLSLNKASSELKRWLRTDSLKLQIRNCWCLKSGKESTKPEVRSNSLRRSEATLSSQVSVQFV